MSSHKGEDYKVAAVKYFNKCNNQSETCRIFECSERSLMRWVERYEELGNIQRQNRPNIAYKVEKQHVKFILQKIRKNPAITVKEIHEQLLYKFTDIDISRTHVNSIILENNVTYKRSRLRHEPTHRYGKEIDIKQQIAEFYKQVGQYNINDIICIDETSLQAFMARKYCRNIIEKRCIIKTESQEVFKKYTGIFAITTRGCIDYEIYQQGGITAERLLEFLKRVLGRRRDKVVILDNASSHRSPIVRNYIEERNSLLYSVPYQHYTNAIENFFSVMKSHIQTTGSIGWNALLSSVRCAVQQITITQYRNIISGAYTRKRGDTYKKNKSTREKVPKRYLS